MIDGIVSLFAWIGVAAVFAPIFDRLFACAANAGEAED